MIVGVGSIDKDSRLTIESGFVNKHPVKVLKDSGCTGIVVRRKLVRPDQVTSDEKKCVLIDNSVRICPVPNIYIDTPFHTGDVEAICMENPICDLIIGKVTPCDLMVSQGHLGLHGQPSSPNSEKEVSENTSKTVSNSPEVLGAMETRFQSKKKAAKPLKVNESKDVADNLTCEDQEADLSLQRLLNQVDNNSKRVELVKENGLWFKLGSNKQGEVINQLLVPEYHRKQTLSLAHESLMGGHLGVQKTSDRILQNFY